MIEIGHWRPNYELAAAISQHGPEEARYANLYDETQKRVRTQLAVNFDVIVAMTLRGQSSKMVAATFGVSRQAITDRLHLVELARSRGRAKSHPAASTR